MQADGFVERRASAVLSRHGAIVATPSDTHADVAVACLEGGLHVLVEKPIAVAHGDSFERQIANFRDVSGGATEPLVSASHRQQRANHIDDH